MQVTVIPQDKTIVIDGNPLTFDFRVWPPKLHAIQWNGTSGTMEFKQGASQYFDNVDFVQPYIDAYFEEAARIAAE
jgi:hypothetical protein